MFATTRYVRFLQAVIVLSGSSGILYCLWHAPIDVPREWGTWIAVNVVALLCVPLAMVLCFFDEGPGEFGLRLGETKGAWKWIAGFLLFMLPLLLLAAPGRDFQSFYPRYQPAKESVAGFCVLIVTVGIYMLGWEYLFRGFMLFGMAPSFGWFSVVLQAIPFGLSHWGNPRPEILGSFFAGVALGALAWRFKSFVPGFIVHWTAYVLFNLFVILHW
ncbi:MAG: CPBP family intramembrane metalloprotease [Armatimonadetes bacterium]|nr:CPBP family intramembrane metalloprotease [Armatimonadota bacterium]